MTDIEPVSPGEILLKEFLEPMHISPRQFAKDIKLPESEIDMLLNGTKDISTDIANRLSAFFGTTSEFWMNLQGIYNSDKLRV